MSIAPIKPLIQCVDGFTNISLARPTLHALGVVDHTRPTLMRKFVLEREHIGQSESTPKHNTKLYRWVESMYKSTNLPLVDRGHDSKIGENHDNFPSRSNVHDRLGRVEPGKHPANLQINQPARKPILQEFAGESQDVVMENAVTTGDIVDPVA